MALIFGDQQYKNSRHLNFRLEELPQDPPVLPEERGRIYFNTSDNEVRINTGNTWITVALSSGSANPLLDTLGRNWLNEDQSFNPVPFNKLNEKFNFDSNNTLFDVLESFNELINSSKKGNFFELTDVEVGNASPGDVLIYGNDGSITTSDLKSLIEARAPLDLNDLTNVVLHDLNDGDTLKYFGKTRTFRNYRDSYEYMNTAMLKNHTIRHDLDTQYAFVQVINPQTKKMITDFEVEFLDSNLIHVTLGTASPVAVIIRAA